VAGKSNAIKQEVFMSEIKNYQVGLIKSLSMDGEFLRGIIETVNDKDNPIIPFVIQDSSEALEEGKMVKFIKTGSIVQRAVEVTNL
jgi:hypothetical protein